MRLRIGGGCAATLAVTGYPAEVSAGWLDPLTAYPGRLDVTLHIEPIPTALAAARLRRQRTRLESGRRLGAHRGQLDDPEPRPLPTMRRNSHTGSSAARASCSASACT